MRRSAGESRMTRWRDAGRIWVGYWQGGGEVRVRRWQDVGRMLAKRQRLRSVGEGRPAGVRGAGALPAEGLQDTHKMSARDARKMFARCLKNVRKMSARRPQDIRRPQDVCKTSARCPPHIPHTLRRTPHAPITPHSPGAGALPAAARGVQRPRLRVAARPRAGGDERVGKQLRRRAGGQPRRAPRKEQAPAPRVEDWLNGGREAVESGQVMESDTMIAAPEPKGGPEQAAKEP
eukprot:gene270-biopygen5177